MQTSILDVKESAKKVNQHTKVENEKRSIFTTIQSKQIVKNMYNPKITFFKQNS